MMRMRVEYDAYDRKFKLLDREFGSMLEDGAVYQLAIPLPVLHAIDDENSDFLSIDAQVAQA